MSKSAVVVNLSVTATHNSAQMVTQYFLNIHPAVGDHVTMPHGANGLLIRDKGDGHRD